MERSLSAATKQGTRRISPAWILFCLWACLVLVQIPAHVVWRDEMRALSFALQGRNLFEMWGAVRGDAHPLLWPLMLRIAHMLVPVPQVLPFVAFAVAAAAAWLLVMRSPFALVVMALILLSRFFLFEYSVMARNYGISMLLMFAFAALYKRHRDHGFALGILLFLLCNTNVHSVVLAGALMLFWLIDIVGETGFRWSAGLRTVLLNATIMFGGVVACVLTVYPTFNDAAVPNFSRTISSGAVWLTLINPAPYYDTQFILKRLANELMGPLAVVALEAIDSAILFGSTLGLVHRPAALVAAIVGLLGLGEVLTLFEEVGDMYRHQTLWLCFLISLYWIALKDEPGACASQRTELDALFGAGGAQTPSQPRATGASSSWIAGMLPGLIPARTHSRTDILRSMGYSLFLLLLGIQAGKGVATVVGGFHGEPAGRTREFATFVKSRPDLQDAIILGDPDYLIEPLRYYLGNETYLPREGRFGAYAKFTKKARTTQTLDDLYADSCRLQSSTGKPVIILLSLRLKNVSPNTVFKSSYNWTLTTTPEQVERFLGSTQLLASYGPAETDETYDAYLATCTPKAAASILG
jgi:hypothetical protein